MIVCAHLGRPGGRPDLEYSLAPVAARLGGLVGQEVDFPGDIVGRQARAAIAALRPGGVVMLENLRFDAAETSKDDMARGYFADRFAAPADLYVAVGFRRYAPQARQCLRRAAAPDQRGWLPGPGRGGRAARLTADIQRPYVVVLGGAKVADKFDALGSLLSMADRIRSAGPWPSRSSPPAASRPAPPCSSRARSTRLNLEFFRRRRFSAAVGSVGLVTFGLFGALFVMTQFLQFALGYSALQAGIRALPAAGAIAIVAPLSTAAVRVAGTKLTVAAGLLAVAGGLWQLSTASAATTYTGVLPGLVLLGVGAGLAIPSATEFGHGIAAGRAPGPCGGDGVVGHGGEPAQPHAREDSRAGPPPVATRTSRPAAWASARIVSVAWMTLAVASHGSGASASSRASSRDVSMCGRQHAWWSSIRSAEVMTDPFRGSGGSIPWRSQPPRRSARRFFNESADRARRGAWRGSL